MNSLRGIPKQPPGGPSLDFNRLREEGIGLIQALSGQVWTDYNLHDPGVTTLEVLCYALTELGYRTQLLEEAFAAEAPTEPDFIDRYFFRPEELLPPLPVTKGDFEQFIENNHPNVLSAWFEEATLFNGGGAIRGGYEVALLLNPDEQFGNLNTDVLRISLEPGGTELEFLFFDENSRRMSWSNIREIVGCRWDEQDPDSFFGFEQFNFQVALVLEVIVGQPGTAESIPVKARGTLASSPKSRRMAKVVDSYREAILQKLESAEFSDALAQLLAKEHHKASLLANVQRTLLPCRNLCEDFVALRVVNEQEIKVEADIALDRHAPAADLLINQVFDRLDAFLLGLVRQAKQAAHRTPKNVLYASNLIGEMVKVAGVEAASIRTLNLLVDGVPTIPLREEASFECIHLQPFSSYVPRISREKSRIAFVRSGTKEKTSAGAVSMAYQRHLSPASDAPAAAAPERVPPNVLNAHFFENLRHYYSIQNDFPPNYRLREGPSSQAPEAWKVKIGQFKAYLVFFERVLAGYLDQLAGFHDLLSVKQIPGLATDELELKNQLPPDGFQLVDEEKWKAAVASTPNRYEELLEKHRMVDHLLARFATRFTPVITEPPDVGFLEKTLLAKQLLLRDVPLVTRERGLGLPTAPRERKVWEGDILSGFQKRLYRLLGVDNEALRHVQLTKRKGSEPAGFYLVEHILLLEQKERTIFTKKFNRAAELLHAYVRQLSTDYQKHPPYSFQLTIVLPDWYTPWNARRNTVETLIREELPAHLLPSFHWLNKKTLGEFEILYEDWLNDVFQVDRF